MTGAKTEIAYKLEYFIGILDTCLLVSFVFNNVGK